MSSVSAAIFDEATGLVPDVLLPREARSRITALAAALPSAIPWVMTEHRLSRDDARVDSIAATTASWGGRDLALLSEPEAAAAGLASYLPFFRAWATPSSLLHRDVEAVWFEYDVLPGDVRAPVPFVPFSVDPGYHRSVRHLVAPPSYVRSLASVGLETLYGRRWDPAILAMLEHCAAELPALGRVLHVAGAPQRGHDDLRVYVHLPVTEVLQWLQRIGWRGNYGAAARAIEATGLRVALTGVHIDVGETVRPYFAVERNLHTEGQIEEAQAVMRRLVALGACYPAKGCAAATSIGRTHWAPSPTEHPMVIQRDLCIKIIAAGDSVEAKAYLGFRSEEVLTRPRLDILGPRNRPTAVER